MTRHRLYSALVSALAVAFLCGSSGSARDGTSSIDEPRVVASGNGVRITEIEPQFYLASDATSNVLVFAGEEVSFVAGVQRPPIVTAVKSFLAERRAARVQYALILEDADALPLGDGGWGGAGAVTMIHEDSLRRMRRAAKPKEPDAGPRGMA